MKFVHYNSANVIAILESAKTRPSEEVESETIELKFYRNSKALHNAKELAEEVCALANTQGGVIIIGVVDSNNLNGSSWSDQLMGFEKVDEFDVESRILGRIQNTIELNVENVSFEGKSYLAIFVKKM